MTRMNNEVKGLKVNYVERRIEVTKVFLKAAEKPGTKEFEMMIFTMQQCPGFAIIVKDIEVKKDKEAYNGLTIEKMLAYLHVFQKDELKDFERCVRVYVNNKSGKVQKGKYATIKKLFLNKYKEAYSKLNVDQMVLVDDKEKELKAKSKGIVGNIVVLDNVIEMNNAQKKVVNQ